MWMDAIVSLIFVFSSASGYRYGFVRTVIHTLRWILCLLLSFFVHMISYNFFRYKTNYYDIVYDKIIGRMDLNDSYSAGPLVSDMPAIVQEFIDPIANNVATSIASGIADIIFKLILFIFFVLIFRFIIMLIVFTFGKKNKRGVLGFFDSTLGLFTGMIKGLLLIFLLLAIAIPLSGLTFCDGFVMHALESSKIAGVLYDNNYLLLVIRGVFI